MDGAAGDVAGDRWTREARDFWHRIAAHPFEDPTIALDFTQRLARTLGWSLETARAGIEEYRRFCFLAAVATGTPVTPSEEVDEVWHLHLTYTRDYWEAWCGTALKRKLHHDPTSGGPLEQTRYRSQYAETLALYESYFGPPPAAFWPGTVQRFAARTRFQTIDRNRQFALSRPSLRGLRVPGLVAILGLFATPASAADSWNPLDWPGEAFLMLFVCLVALAALVTMLLRDRVRATGGSANLRDLSSIATAWAAGGVERAADTLFLELAVCGAANHSDKQVTISQAIDPLPPHLEPFRRELQGTTTRRKMIADFKSSAPARAMRDTLVRRNILLDAGRRKTLGFAYILPVGLVIAFGLIKMAVGLSRGRPVGFLVLLCVVAVVGMVWSLKRERYTTRAADDALANLRTTLDRAIRAPRAQELALAFALGGTAVLAGTEHAAYAKFINASGGGDGGSGCGGGGGGGCGGCSS